MYFVENIKEGLRSIGSNLLRTILTAMIVAIGITALVGTLTAIEGMKSKINDSLSGFGANSFDIKDISRRRSSQGKSEKVYPILKYKELKKFKELYRYHSSVGIQTNLSGNAEVKFLSVKTNPNIRIIGGDENYLNLKNYDLGKGRGFSGIEVSNGAHVAILGKNIAKELFKKGEPIGKEISFLGRKFKVIGILKEQGGMDGGSVDKQIIIPLETANAMSTQRSLRYRLTAGVNSPEEMEYAIGEATGLMRAIRKDVLGNPDSFEISKSDSIAETLEDIAGYFRYGAFIIGFITLLGASIGLMNIMMVSVTERTREIGIRKALGATPLKIRQQFLIEAIVICLLGGLAGVLLGILIGNMVASFIGSGGFIVPWIWVFVGLTVCIIVGLVSGYLPAFKASKLDPIESLRFE